MSEEEKVLANACRLQQIGELRGAVALYKTIYTPEARHLEALCLARLGKLDAAIQNFLKALESLSDDPILHNNLANAYKQTGQYEAAIVHYQRAIALTSDYAEAHNNLAGVYAMQGAYDKALYHYKTALHSAPDFTLGHYNLGLFFLKNNLLTEALIQFNNVLALHEDHLNSLFYIGVLHLEANRLEEAQAAFKAVLKLDTSHVEAHTNLGVVYLKQKQNQMAIDCFSKALAIDNALIEARNNLASAFMHFDRFENALMHYDVLLASDPDNIEYLYNSGVAQMALGHLTEATRHFEHLLRLDDNHFAALNNLAAIYMRKEDRVKAKALLQQAVKANPQDKPSQHMLAALSQDQETGQASETCKEYAENLFDNYALYYDQHVQKYLKYALPNQILRLLDRLSIKKIDQVLDLGCGTGLTGQVLRDLSQFLVGVDISEKMRALAEAKQIYDKVVKEDILEYLKESKHSYGLIVAADVLPYWGDLEQLFEQVALHLSDKGYFIFSTEISDTPPWKLQPSVRFAHHIDYLKELFIKYGFQCLYQEEVVARQQEGKALSVYLIALSL